MTRLKKCLSSVLVFPLSYLLIVAPATGCSAQTQAKVNQAVQTIETWTPVVAADANTLLTDIATFAPSDAAVLNSAAALIQSDVAPVEALCQAYLANPTAGTLSQITALINSAATANSGALLQLVSVKDPNSQIVAKGVLTTIAATLTIIAGLLAGTGQVAVVTLPKGFDLNQAVLKAGLVRAQAVGLAPQGMTVGEAVFYLEMTRVIRRA